MRKIPDLDNLYYVFYKVKAGKKKNNVEVNDLIKIYRTVKTLDEMLQNLEGKGGSSETLDKIINDIGKNVKSMQTICKMIEDNLVMDDR